MTEALKHTETAAKDDDGKSIAEHAEAVPPKNTWMPASRVCMMLSIMPK